MPFYIFYIYFYVFIIIIIIVIIINGNASSETVNNICGKQPTSYLQVTASWLLKIKITS